MDGSKFDISGGGMVGGAGKQLVELGLRPGELRIPSADSSVPYEPSHSPPLVETRRGPVWGGSASWYRGGCGVVFSASRSLAAAPGTSLSSRHRGARSCQLVLKPPLGLVL
jgi:hypothetical protein